MGADGGSIPDRRDLVKTKGKAEITDKALVRELFFLCALSKRPLTRPVVLDPLGKLYNKDALLEYFIDKTKYGDGDSICGYLKSLKELLTLNLTSNPTYTPPSSSTTAQLPAHAPFACPLSLKEMSGSVPFIALRHCGCVFSDASIRAVIPSLTRGVAHKVQAVEDKPDEAKSLVDLKEKDAVSVGCPNCTKEFDPTKIDSIISVNPPKDVQEVLLEQLLTNRALAKSSKKRKITETPTPTTTTPIDITVPDIDLPRKHPRAESLKPNTASRNSSASPAPSINGPRSVHQKLAEQEQKRQVAQAGMSDAVKAMFKPKEKGKDHHQGNADFFGRTFTRYA